MNRKQRLFEDVGRLMRSHRHPVRAGRGLRFDTAPGGGGGGGGAATLDFPKVEVPKQFKLDNPKSDVPDAIERLRATAEDLNKHGQFVGEQFQRFRADLDEVVQAQKETRAGLRDLARDVPAPEGPDAPVQSLKHLSLGLEIKPGEERTMVESNDTAGEHVAREFSTTGFTRGQYNLLVRTAKELGITDERTARQLKRLHSLHDATVFMNQCREKDINYIMAGAHKSLPWWGELQALGKKFLGALSDATTNEGKEWVPVNILSGTIVELIELELQFASAFARLPMTGPTMKLPVKKAHTISKYIRENVADAGDATDATLIASSFQTQDATLTAKKHAALVYTSSEWEQDAVVNVPTYITSEMATAIARGLEWALVSAQAAGTIDDSAPASTDTAAMFDAGIRKAFAMTGLAGKDLGAGMIAEDLAAIFGAQGAFGVRPQDCVWLTGTAGLARLMVAKFSDGSPVCLTQAQLGRPGTWQTGVMAEVFGRRVFASEFVPENMDANGIVTTIPATRTALYHINTRPGKIGDRRGVVIDRSSDFRFIQDQLAYRAIARNDFVWAFTPSGTNKVVNAGLNIPTF